MSSMNDPKGGNSSFLSPWKCSLEQNIKMRVSEVDAVCLRWRLSVHVAMRRAVIPKMVVATCG